MTFGPQPGPQRTFAETDADFAIFGGTAAGGKSWCLCYEAAKLCAIPYARAVRAILFRRSDVDLVAGGGLWDTSGKVFRPMFGEVARARGGTLDWVVEAESGEHGDLHRVEFDHLKSDAELERFDGPQFDLVGFDQIEQFTARQVFYLLGRLRSTSGLTPRARASCNPRPGWLAEFLSWWIGPDGYAIPERSGVVRWFARDTTTDAIVWFSTEREAEAWCEARGVASWGNGKRALSCTFVLSRGVYDNPALLAADPGAAARQALWTRQDRLRLVGELDKDGRARGGCWHDLQGAGRFFDVSKWKPASVPPSPIRAVCRFWDRAASEPTRKHPNPDETAGVLAALCEGGEIWIRECRYLTEGPVRALGRMLETAHEDGQDVTIGLYQDTGGAGKSDAETAAAVLDGFQIEIVDSFGQGGTELDGDRVASRSKRALAKVPARMGEEGRIYFDPDGEGIAKLRAQCHHFPQPGQHDDGPDALAGCVRVLPMTHTTMAEAMAAIRARSRR